MSEIVGCLGIMQPYFFPYLGYFALIARSDRWVVLDVTQYTPKSWMNRNRILHPETSWMYVTVPVHGGSQNALIRQVMLENPVQALDSIRRKLGHYRKRAPHYEAVIGLIERTFATRSGDSLVDIDTSGLKVVCDYLDIRFSFDASSQMGLDFSQVAHPGQWALRISEQLGAAAYVNPAGGAKLFRRQEFDASGIRLLFLEMPPMTYSSVPYEFIPSLSILDVLMWNDPGDVRQYIEDKPVLLPAGSARV